MLIEAISLRQHHRGTDSWHTCLSFFSFATWIPSSLVIPGSETFVVWVDPPWSLLCVCVCCHSILSFSGEERNDDNEEKERYASIGFIVLFSLSLSLSIVDVCRGSETNATRRAYVSSASKWTTPVTTIWPWRTTKARILSTSLWPSKVCSSTLVIIICFFLSFFSFLSSFKWRNEQTRARELRSVPARRTL